jgi:hypothetical protein
MANPYMTLNFEGKLYIAPYSSTSPITSPYASVTENGGFTLNTGAILAANIRNPQIHYADTEIDATLRRHLGNKAYVRGMRDFNATLELANLKLDNGTRPPDVALLLSALNDRRKLITAFFIDEELGEGPFGDFLLFFGDGGGEDDGVNMWNITMRPAAFGRALDWHETEVTS